MHLHTTISRRAHLVCRATRSLTSETSRRGPLTDLSPRLRKLAQTRTPFGCDRLRELMPREGW